MACRSPSTASARWRCQEQTHASTSSPCTSRAGAKVNPPGRIKPKDFSQLKMYRRLAKARQKVKMAGGQFVNWFFSDLEEQAEDPRTTAGVKNLLGVLAWDIYSHCAASSLASTAKRSTGPWTSVDFQNLLNKPISRYPKRQFNPDVKQWVEPL